MRKWGLIWLALPTDDRIVQIRRVRVDTAGRCEQTSYATNLSWEKAGVEMHSFDPVEQEEIFNAFATGVVQLKNMLARE